MFSLLPIKNAKYKSLFFSSCKCIKMNPNLKILLPDWSKIKLGLIFTHWHDKKSRLLNLAPLYSIWLFTQYLQLTPNIGLIFVQKTKMFDILFLLLSLKVKTLQLRSIVYIISMRVQKKTHSWLLNRKSFWFIERTRLYLLKQSMTWLDLNHDFFKMKIFNPFIIFHHS